nr:olfactory receptor 5M11-like [Cavia porcellus]
MDNSSTGTESVLLGLTDCLELQPLLLALFLLASLVTTLGNLGMVELIGLDSRLHMPMYFFLTHLGLVDLCYIFSATLKMLTNFLSDRETISFAGCFTQYYVFIALLPMELSMLAVIIYDHYMAICLPLHDTVKMSWPVCISLATLPYDHNFSDGLLHIILTFRLTFCRSSVINHFYSVDPTLIKLSYSDSYVKEYAMFISADFNLSTSLSIILVSYACIVTTVLRILSTEGQCKAFSICGSHLTGITLFYGTLFCIYIRPPIDETVEKSKIIAVFCTFISPTVNLLMYSVRNKDVKQALKDVIRCNIRQDSVSASTFQ